MNKIHYLVTIDTGSDYTDLTLGIENGVFRLSSDNYDPVAQSATFEDLTPVSGNWNTALFSTKAIVSSAQSIDIISGGDFSFLGNLTIELANENKIHEKLKETTNFYLGGSDVVMYVAIDNVLYKRWVGVVAEDTFTDKVFTIKCSDKSSTSNSTIEGVYGLNDTAYVPVVEEAPLLDRTFISRTSPENTREATFWVFKSAQNEDIPTGQELTDYYVGGSLKSEFIVSDNSQVYNIYLSGKYEEITAGMYLKVGDGEELFVITSVGFGSSTTPEGVIDTTLLKLNDRPENILNFTQFYGPQPSGLANNDIREGTSVADSETLNVSVFAKGLVYPKPTDGQFVTDENGKYVAIDENGNTIKLDGSINADGSLTIITTEYTELLKPVRIRHWSEDLSNDPRVDNVSAPDYDLISQGKFTHLENKGSTITGSVPNDTDVDGEYYPGSYRKYNYYVCEFDENIDELQPFVLLNAFVDSLENWFPTISQTFPETSCTFFGENHTAAVDRQTEYFSPYVTSDFATFNQLFNGFEIEVYRVVEDKVRGEIPILATNFTTPNIRARSDLQVADNGVVSFRAKSVSSTNLPLRDITTSESGNRVITTSNNVLSYEWEEVGAFRPFLYADGTVQISKEEELKDANKLLFVMYPLQDVSESETPIGGSYQGHYFRDDSPQGEKVAIGLSERAFIGVNSIGAFKVNRITDLTNITIKTEEINTRSYNGFAQFLSGSGDALFERQNWLTGAQFTEKQNRFDVLTKLLKQGFVAGFTDRVGNIKLDPFRESSGTTRIINNSTSVDKSMKSFKLSPISKCYNDFSVKYHNSNGEYVFQIDVTNVDQSSFPPPYELVEGVGQWSEPIDAEPNSIFDTPLLLRYTFGESKPWSLEFDTSKGQITTDLLNWFTLNSGKIYRSTTGGTNPPFQYANLVFNETSGSKEIYFIDFAGGDFEEPAGNGQWVVYDAAFNTADNFTWKTYVSGVPSYADAKLLWERAHESWQINKRIRTAPNDRSNLEYSRENGEFFLGNKQFDPFGYGWNYVQNLVEWTTRQKYQINEIRVPLNIDTVTWNIMDKVQFSDPLITDPGEFGNGWITKYRVDTVKNNVVLEITFDIDFVFGPSQIDCDIAIETGSATEEFIEGQGGDDAIEGNCS